MKIKKTFQGIIPGNKILNSESTSETDTYSCKYIDEKAKISIENPFIANENYEFVEESIFKQGKHYFGYLTIHKKTGTFDGTSESVATSEKIPVGNYHLFGLGSTTQWNVPTNNADVFLSSAKIGTILINCNGCAYVKFYIDFMVY